jgi:hypothetical protein
MSAPARLHVDAVSTGTATLSGDVHDLRAVAANLGGGVVVLPLPGARPSTILSQTTAALLACADLGIVPISIHADANGTRVHVDAAALAEGATDAEWMLERQDVPGEFPVELWVEVRSVRVSALATHETAERLLSRMPGRGAA